MDTSTIVVIAAATAVAVYVVFFYKPEHHFHPVEDKCVITFLNTKNTVLDRVNSMYVFLNDFAVHYGTKKQGISGPDPLLVQLSTTISNLKSMNNVRTRSQVITSYSKIIDDVNTILSFVGKEASPNVRIMSNGRFNTSLSIYFKYADMLTPFPKNIPILSANCAHESFIY
jgi:hypothetical protein